MSKLLVEVNDSAYPPGTPIVVTGFPVRFINGETVEVDTDTVDHDMVPDVEAAIKGAAGLNLKSPEPVTQAYPEPVEVPTQSPAEAPAEVPTQTYTAPAEVLPSQDLPPVGVSTNSAPQVTFVTTNDEGGENQ